MRSFILSLFLVVTMPAVASGLKNPVSSVVQGDCELALALAERALVEQFSNSLSQEEVDWKLASEYRLVGLWFGDDASCEVYDLMTLKSEDDVRSPHEILEEDVLEHMLEDGAISRYEVAGNGRFYLLYE